MKGIVSAQEAQRDPTLLWNEFIHLLAFSEPAQLDSTQLPAHLAFWYDSEVQNGGHLQYFENRPTELVPETIRALSQLGASQQAEVLMTAFKRWRSRRREKLKTAEEYVGASLELEFSDLDSAYCTLNPSVTELLEKCLEADRDTFIDFSA